MSDKQTTAVVLMVILALVFYLYNNGKLATVVGTITGKSPTETITATAANLAANTEAATTQNYNGIMQGLNTGYFLNSIYGIDSNNTVQYTASNSNNSNTASNIETAVTLAGLLGA